MVTIEENKEGTDCRGQKQQPILGEDIGIEYPIAIADPHFVLSRLIVTIQW